MAKTIPWRILTGTVAGLSLACALGVWLTNRHVLNGGGPIYDHPSDVPHRTVILVPGARVHQDGTPYPALADRLTIAVEAYKLNKGDKILVSGDHQYDGYDEVNGMRTWLIQAGVPSEVIFMDHAGIRTFDTMARAASVFGVTEAIICTQRFHLSRSVYLAQQAGINAVGLVSDRREYPKATMDALRETFARTVAVLDVHVLSTQPRFKGPKISMEGDAAQTHDRFTQRPAE